MNESEIIALAEKYGIRQFGGADNKTQFVWFTDDKLLQFAAALTAAQKEKDATICLSEKVDAEATRDVSDASYNFACEHCADAIRERKD